VWREAARLQGGCSSKDIAGVRAGCDRIRVGFAAFTPAERRQAYELLESRVRPAAEDGI